MSKKKQSRVAHKERSRHKPILRYVLVVVFAMFTYFIAIKFAEPRMLPIKQVKIDARMTKFDIASLKKRMQPYIKGFFSTNMVTLKEVILSDPFVDQVIIKRIWPDTLLVSLRELTLVANWNNVKAVSSKGELVNVKVNETQNLPLFQGPDNQVATLLEVYNEFSEELHPLNLAISEIRLNLRHSWRVTLDNGLRLFLGRRDLSSHLHAFVKVYPRLKKIHGDNMESVDLRHTNGISVQLAHAE